MDLEPLRVFVSQHQLETSPAFSLLDVTAELGEAARELLRATDYGKQPAPHDAAATAQMRRKIGNLMFAVAYLSTLYDVDPEAALWESVQRFAEKLDEVKE